MTLQFDPRRAFAYRIAAIPAMMQDDIREAMMRDLPALPAWKPSKTSNAPGTLARKSAQKAQGLRRVAARMKQIQPLFDQGMSNTQIGLALGIDEATARRYVRRIKAQMEGGAA